MQIREENLDQGSVIRAESQDHVKRRRKDPRS